MKDNISLIAAAAGGFMLSVAISGILKAAPVISLNAPPNLSSTPLTNLQTSSTSSVPTASFAGSKATPQTRSQRFEKRS